MSERYVIRSGAALPSGLIEKPNPSIPGYSCILTVPRVGPACEAKQPAQPSIPQRCFVVARTGDQGRAFCHANREYRHAHVVGSEHQLLGINNCLVVILFGARRRRDWPRIKETLSVCAGTICGVDIIDLEGPDHWERFCGIPRGIIQPKPPVATCNALDTGPCNESEESHPLRVFDPLFMTSEMAWNIKGDA